MCLLSNSADHWLKQQGIKRYFCPNNVINDQTSAFQRVQSAVQVYFLSIVLFPHEPLEIESLKADITQFLMILLEMYWTF